MAAPLLSLVLLALAIGVLPLGLPLQAAALAVLLLSSLLLLRRSWSAGRCLAVALVLLLAWGWGLRGQPQPGPQDPVQRIPATGSATTGNTVAAELRGQLLSDPQPGKQGQGCRVLLQLQKRKPNSLST